MKRDNQLLVTNEPVEFEKQPIEVQDFRKITNYFREIYQIYPQIKFSFSFETKGQQANAKTHDAINHLTSLFCQVETRFQSRESNRQPLP